MLLMKTHNIIKLSLLMGFAALALTSCQAMLQSMWTPRTSLPGEEKIQTPATLVSVSQGLKLENRGSVHVSSTFCKFCTDAGKTYRGDLMPLLLSHPAYGRSILDTSSELPYRKGQKGILTVGSQSGVVFSFMPYEYMGEMEKNRQAWEIRAAAERTPVSGSSF